MFFCWGHFQNLPNGIITDTWYSFPSIFLILHDRDYHHSLLPPNHPDLSQGDCCLKKVPFPLDVRHVMSKTNNLLKFVLTLHCFRVPLINILFKACEKRELCKIIKYMIFLIGGPFSTVNNWPLNCFLLLATDVTHR